MKKTPNRLKLLSASVALSAIGMLAMGSTSASASGAYYTCDAPTSCKKVDRRILTTSYNATKYPIVMVHGFFGWNRLIGSYDYFNGVPQTYMGNGAEVFATKTSSVNSSEVRGEQLLKQINYVTAITGSPKVNLMGHSQGGIDSRYIATVVPNKVASVTEVSSPNQGTLTSDFIKKNLLDSNNAGVQLGNKILIAAVEAVGFTEDVLSGVPLDQLQEQSALNFVNTTNTASIAEFNTKYPAPIPSTYCGQPTATKAPNGVPYYSWAGTGNLTNVLDASDYVLSLAALTHNGIPNDGLVDYCSTRVGYVIRDDYRMNHLDTINQLFGLSSLLETNPLTVYSTQANRLKKAGY